MLGLVFGVFLLAMLLALPMAVGMGLATIVPHLMNSGFPGNVNYIIQGMIGGLNTTPILAIPLFMLSGALMTRGGISKKLFDIFSIFAGTRTAGIPCAVVVTCLFYGAISGSGPATAAAVGAMCIPILVELGYDKVFAAAIVATAGGDTELIQGAQMGNVDIFNGAPTSQVGLIPQLAVLDIAGLYDNVDQCNQVLSGGFLDQIEPYYNKAGLHLLTAYTTDFRITSSNKPINSLADLKGLNLRVQENKYHIAFWKALGANPTPLAFGELYIALQQGMMDAQENPWVSYVGAKLCEVQKDMTLTNHIPFISTYVMNDAKYKGMSDAQKQALNQFIYSVKKYIVEGTAADDARLQKLCVDQYGLVVSDVPADIKAKYPEATQAVIDLMKKDIDPTFVDNYVTAAKTVTGK